MTKIDLKKTLNHLYNPSPKAVSVVDVPPLAFLQVDGHGDPNTSPAFQAALEALYAVSYAAKFMVKRAQGVDYAVMPLEGLWWSEDMTTFTARRKADWSWTAMIVQPERVTAELARAAMDDAARKKDLPALAGMRFATVHEGLAVQIMHLGSFDAEAPVIERLHQTIADNGWTLAGKHHEIYLSDFRRTAPEKLRTVIRQPFRRDA